MKGEQKRGHILYQPPDAAELERYPPRNSVCARYRGMLRDYADQDLAPRDRAAVDDHLHTCRDCSLALARAEHEVLRIRAALTGQRPGQEAPTWSFRAPAGFADAVRRRLQETPAARPSRHHRWWVLLPVAAAAVAGLRLLAPSGDPAGPVVTLVSATDATWLDHGEGMAARAGDTRAAGALLQVGDSGHAGLRLDADAVLRIEADSLFRVGDRQRAPSTLYRGALAIESGAVVDLEVPGAGRLRLGSGRYLVSARPYRRFDAALTPETQTRVRLEVLAGEPAGIVQRGGRVREVAEGQVARFDGWTQVVVGRALSEPRLLAALRPRTGPSSVPTVSGTSGSWLGRVTDPRGLGVPGATVHLLSRQGREDVVTDRDGRFSSIDLERLGGEDIVLQVTPPPGPVGRQDLAMYGPAPRHLRETPDGDGFLLGSVPLPPERPVGGRIRDEEDFRSVSGARVVPLIMDELLGTVHPLWPLHDRQSGADGEFALHHLPATTGPHTSLVLLVDHDDYAPVLSYALAGTAPAQRDRILELGLPRGQRIEIQDLTEQSDVGFSLPGLPPGSLLWMRVPSQADGRAVVHAGERTELWVRAQPEAAELVALTPGPVGRAERAGSRLRALLPGDADGRGRLKLAGSHRYGQLAGDGRGRTVVFSVVDAQSAAARGTRLFLISDQAPAVYLGDYDGMTGFSASLPEAPVRILALGPNGETGLIQIAADSPERVQVPIRTPGNAVLDTASRPDLQGPEFLDLEFHSRDGILPGRRFTRRVLRDQGWQTSGLVPGLYDVREIAGDRAGQCRITPGDTAELSLR